MQKRKHRYWIIPVVLLAIAAGVWFAYPRLIKEERPAFVTVKVAKRDIQETVSCTGVLDAYRQVDVGAQVSGQIETLKVALGDHVTKGQLLAVIDPSVKQNDLLDAQAQLKSVRAQKRSKQALLKQYELEYERQQTMRSQDASATADLEGARANLESTKADIEALDAGIAQAKIALDTAKTNLAYTQIVAPMDGTVVAVETDEGQTLVSTQSAPTILILADLTVMTVKSLISEADVIRVKQGMPVFFSTLGDPDTRYKGTLRSVDPAPESITDTDTSAKTISSSATYYNGQFEVNNPDGKLRIFMTAEVSIVLGEVKGALSIPLSVLGSDRGNGRYEVRVLKNGRAEPRMIETGFKDNINIQVLKGLSEGDEVVVGDSQSAAEDLSNREDSFRGPPPGGGGGPPPGM